MTERITETNERLYAVANKAASKAWGDAHEHHAIRVPVLQEWHPGREVYAWVCADCRQPMYEMDPNWIEYLELSDLESEEW